MNDPHHIALHRLDRRRFGGLMLGLLSAQGAAAQAPTTDAELAARLRAGGCAVMLRHSRTDPGVGDPPEFVIGQCRTQRNLSAAGREQSAAIGRWFETRALKPSAVLSSAWCRCIDTATLAFGQQEPWPALDSSFGRGEQAQQARPQLLARLRSIAPGRFEVWVTHQVNITALTGESTSMGEAVVLDASAKVVGRSSFGVA
ncbi:histidine phosphatase family protein [Variovorax dokdonensis]|uniref:Histidine phosphatase family protein n=1 Tax=Variovorax dokdonensis TaxID=344883 RepID=A0ABT7NDU6_9BURK|nr:histidine phosphatase family protein [Variovorax dokdonensis]MDM0046122.1 histidine phosphatase family protein [Variovorax dokdonensis]